MAGEVPIRVVVVEDHALFRRGLQMVLESEPHIDVVAEAVDGHELLPRIDELAPDVVLMDLCYAKLSNIRATKELLAQAPSTRVLLLVDADFDEDVDVSEAAARLLDALRAGAVGYLLKEISIEEVAATVEHVAAGQILMSPSDADGILSESGSELLRPVERAVLTAVAAGNTDRAIASSLAVSEGEVKLHLHNAITRWRTAFPLPDEAYRPPSAASIEAPSTPSTTPVTEVDQVEGVPASPSTGVDTSGSTLSEEHEPRTPGLLWNVAVTTYLPSAFEDEEGTAIYHDGVNINQPAPDQLVLLNSAGQEVDRFVFQGLMGSLPQPAVLFLSTEMSLDLLARPGQQGDARVDIRPAADPYELLRSAVTTARPDPTAAELLLERTTLRELLSHLPYEAEWDAVNDLGVDITLEPPSSFPYISVSFGLDGEFDEAEVNIVKDGTLRTAPLSPSQVLALLLADVGRPA